MPEKNCIRHLRTTHFSFLGFLFVFARGGVRSDHPPPHRNVILNPRGTVCGVTFSRHSRTTTNSNMAAERRCKNPQRLLLFRSYVCISQPQTNTWYASPRALLLEIRLYSAVRDTTKLREAGREKAWNSAACVFSSFSYGNRRGGRPRSYH